MADENITSEPPEITREQHDRIEALAIEHGSVIVHAPTQGPLMIEADGKTRWLNEDGEDVRPEIVAVAFDLGLVRRLLGDDAVDAAIREAGTMAPNQFILGNRLAADIIERVEALADGMANLERGAGLR